MGSTSDRGRIRDALIRLAKAHAQANEEIEIAMNTIAALIDDQSPRVATSTKTASPHGYARADRSTLSVIWRKKSCFLGNTLLLALFERLARSPDRYISADDLMEDVWGGRRDPSTIRGVIKRLRDRLRQAEMHQVAEAIEGRVNGYYRLRRV